MSQRECGGVIIFTSGSSRKQKTSRLLDSFENSRGRIAQPLPSSFLRVIPFRSRRCRRVAASLSNVTQRENPE